MHAGAFAVPCVLCGTDTYPESKMTPYPGRPGSWLCPRDAEGFTLEELDRVPAINLRVPIYPRRNIYRAPTISQMLVEEGRLFSLLTSSYGGGVYQYRSIDITSGDGAVNTTDRDVRAAGWAGIYLWEIINEAKRPASWLARARVRLGEIADWLITYQRGSGSEASEVTTALAAYAAASTTTIDYGGFVNIADLAIYSEDLGACGLALLRAHQIFGDAKYQAAYRRALTCVRRFQQTGKLSSGFTASDSAGTAALNTGMWTHRLAFTGGNKTPDHRFYPGDMVTLEFLAEAEDEEGDLTYGDSTAVGPFGSSTAAALSTMIAECTSFWSAGIKEQGVGSAVVGFSSTTPREFFGAYPGTGNTGEWDYANVADTAVSGLNYALALRGLYASAGFSTQVESVWNWLQAGASNASHEPTELDSLGETRQSTLLAGELGSYDPAIALATEILSASGSNNSTRYEWATVGLLAKLRTANDLADFTISKEAMVLDRYIAATGPDANRVRSPMLAGYSGLSYQVAFVETYDVALASMAGLAFREQPKIYGVA